MVKGKKLNFQETQLREDGQTCLLITSKAPLLDAHNKVVGVVGISQEIESLNLMMSDSLIPSFSNLKKPSDQHSFPNVKLSAYITL